MVKNTALFKNQWFIRKCQMCIQLLRERLSEKVHVTISKGIVGGFEFTVLQRNLKEWTCVCDCQKKAIKVGSKATMSGTVSRAHFFSDHLSRNSCMYITNIFCHFIRLWIKCLYNHLCKGHWRVEIPPPGGIQGKFITLTQNAFSVPSFSGLVEIETGIFAQSQYRATCSNSPLVWVVQNVKRKQRWQKRSEEEKSKAWNLSYHHIVRYPLMARRRYCLLVLELTRGKYALDTSNFTRKKHVDWAMPDLVTALTGHCFESNFCLCADSTFHSIETFHSRTRTFAYSQKINRRQNDAALRARLA